MTDERPTLTVAEVARRLGVSRATVYAMLQRGEITALRTGGAGSRWIISRHSFEQQFGALADASAAQPAAPEQPHLDREAHDRALRVFARSARTIARALDDVADAIDQLTDP